MIKNICVIAVVGVAAWLGYYLAVLTSVLYPHEVYSELGAGSEVIRLHVLANSDTAYDQKLKLKVRDALLRELGDDLAACQSRRQAEAYLLSHRQRLEQVAGEVIAASGFSYPVRIQFGDFAFPAKAYGSMVLPAGDYTAVRVLIGQADGKNWWCVLYPPLCLLDLTRTAANDTTETGEPEPEKTNIVLKWKIAELVGWN